MAGRVKRMARKDLDAVRRAATRIVRFEQELRSAIYQAHESGESFRDIGRHCDRSHTRVAEMYHEERQRREAEAEPG